MLAAVLLVGTGGETRAAGKVLSVEEFNELKGEWPELLGRHLRIEGRYALMGRNLLRFKNCDLSFRSRKDLPKLTGRSRTVEVSGRLTREDGKLFFLIEELFELPTDLERLRQQRSRLDPAKADEWYQLATWAEQRAKFYQDAELAQEARKLYRDGLRIERSRLREGDPRALFALAEKAAGFGLDQSVQLSLIHEACVLLWRQAQRRDDANSLRQLASTVAEKLPGAKTPLTEPVDGLRKRYLAAPLPTYEKADASTRQTLHRILHNEILLAAILKQAAPDGRNGLEIADQIETQLPEYRETATAFRQKGVAYRAAHIATASRSEMLELVELFKKQNQPERARVLILRWLQAREKVLRQDGPDGLRQLAREYETLLQDTKTAVKLLVEAYRLSQEAPEIAKELERRGYRRAGQRWVTLEEFAKTPEGRIVQAMREGRVVEGMTAEQVRKTLGAPSFVARAATDGVFAEVWVYGENRGSRLAIHLSRPLSSRELKVTAVVPLTER